MYSLAITDPAATSATLVCGECDHTTTMDSLDIKLTKDLKIC